VTTRKPDLVLSDLTLTLEVGTDSGVLTAARASTSTLFLANINDIASPVYR